VDSRFSNDHIVSHSEMRHESANSRSAAEVLAKVDPDTEVVGIDEGQFFDNELVSVANELAQRGVRVIIAGLDQDYTGKPWEPMPQLLAIAEYITKTHAICMKCGQPANYTQRTFESEERVALVAKACTKRAAANALFRTPMLPPYIPTEAQKFFFPWHNSVAATS